jgi:UDP-glucose 4-epimerase
MKYLVTGSEGFIGRHLIKNLQAQGHVVSGLDIRNSSGDIRTMKDVLSKAENVDGIFHLAAIASVQQTITDPQGTFETNVTGTRNVFKAGKELGGIPVVYASSAAVYGDNQNLPLKESEKPTPLSPYAEHKYQNEQDARSSGLPTFGLRFFNIYGPGQDPSSPYSGVISVFYDRLKAELPLTVYGDGQQTRDFVAVEDAVTALITAMANVSEGGAVANICTGRSTTLLELIRVLGEILGCTPKIDYQPPKSGDIRHSRGNPDLFQQICGFKAATSLSSGLRTLK